MDETTISPEEMVQMLKDGQFFNFCISFALNNGLRNVMKEDKEVNFTIGNYDVKFDKEQLCFILTHKIYFARIITAYYDAVAFVGHHEQDVIDDLLIEFESTIP